MTAGATVDGVTAVAVALHRAGREYQRHGDWGRYVPHNVACGSGRGGGERRGGGGERDPTLLGGRGLLRDATYEPMASFPSCPSRFRTCAPVVSFVCLGVVRRCLAAVAKEVGLGEQ